MSSDHDVERRVGVLLAQPAHLVVDELRLHRAAAGAVDAQDHALRVLVLERRLQPGHDLSALASGAGRDDPVQLDQRGVLLAAGEVGARLPVDRHDEDQRDVREGEQLEEDAPEPRAPLLFQRRGREPRYDLAFPLPIAVSHREPHEVDLAVALLDAKFHERPAAAGAAHAAPPRASYVAP
jgi:hypothetical protein